MQTFRIMHGPLFRTKFIVFFLRFIFYHNDKLGPEEGSMHDPKRQTITSSHHTSFETFRMIHSGRFDSSNISDENKVTANVRPIRYNSEIQKYKAWRNEDFWLKWNFYWYSLKVRQRTYSTLFNNCTQIKNRLLESDIKMMNEIFLLTLDVNAQISR